jgi:pimeloyl-ACP methyl ester carboxylesterase
MRKSVLFVAWLGVTFVAWWGLHRWVVSGSERFYLVLIPSVLTLRYLVTTAGWVGLKPVLGRILVCYVAVALLAVAGLLLLGQLALLPAARVAPEVLYCSWLATSAGFLVACAYTVLRRLLTAVSARQVVARWLSLAVVFALAVPYLIGFLYVHRFKVPNRPDPQEATGRPCSDVAFATADGLTLRGWFFPCARPSRRTLLICHGLGANRSAFLGYLQVGDALGANILMFDFRGHGDSEGHTVTLGHQEALDVLAAGRYLRDSRSGEAKELIGLGISMGAASLTRAAAMAEPPFDALVLDSGFASAVDMTERILEVYPEAVRPWLTVPGIPLACLHAGCDLTAVRPEEAIGAVRCPVLILHAEQDELIPVSHARRLHARATEPKTLWVAPTGGHSSVLAGARPQYLQAVRRLVGPEADGRRNFSRPPGSYRLSAAVPARGR